MSHVSHLWAVFPGDEINWKNNPEHLAAARKSVEARRAAGCNPVAWPGAWQIALFARFLDGEMTATVIQHMFKTGLSRSWLNASRVFQIDGNLGLLSGMAECLMQSHLGIHFLPALPSNWKNGKVQGLKARGGSQIDITWADSKITEAKVQPMYSGIQKFIGAMPKQILTDGTEITAVKNEDGFEAELEKGKVYQLIF